MGCRTEMLEYVINESLAKMAARRETFEEWYKRTVKEYERRVKDSTPRANDKVEQEVSNETN